MGGLLDPLEGRFKDDLPVAALKDLVRRKGVREVVLCFPYSFEGENTKEFLAEVLNEEFPNLKITTVGENLPKNTPVFYVEESMLKRAIKNRRDVK